jgi:hypothetical protein
MKRLIDTALVYAVAAMAGGVFYREFTRLNGFAGVTALSKIHVHLFVLGMLFFLMLSLLERTLGVSQQKRFWLWCGVYHAGMAVTVGMLAARGVLQVRGAALTRALDAALSGVAGLGHILLGVALVLLLICVRKSAKGAA